MLGESLAKKKSHVSRYIELLARRPAVKCHRCSDSPCLEVQGCIYIWPRTYAPRSWFPIVEETSIDVSSCYPTSTISRDELYHSYRSLAYSPGICPSGYTTVHSAYTSESRLMRATCCAELALLPVHPTRASKLTTTPPADSRSTLLTADNISSTPLDDTAPLNTHRHLSAPTQRKRPPHYPCSGARHRGLGCGYGCVAGERSVIVCWIWKTCGWDRGGSVFGFGQEFGSWAGTNYDGDERSAD
jgi:hypothetical protein